MDAREAARILGVKVATLYSYASRHRVRSFPSGLHREKRYLREDLEGVHERLTWIVESRWIHMKPTLGQVQPEVHA